MNLKPGEIAYAIWKDVDDRNVNGVKDLVGIVVSDNYEKVDEMVDRMNKEDETTAKQLAWHGRVRFGYWKQEVSVLTAKNYKEFITQ